MALNVNLQYPSISTDTYSPDSLIAGMALQAVTLTATLIAGQNLTRGALLGIITASGKYTLSLAASGDGSQIPCAVLAESANAVSDKLVTIYVTGEFNANQVTFGTGHSATTAVTIAGARDNNIFFKTQPLGF